MSDAESDRRRTPRPSTDDPAIRVHSDVARKVDLDRLETGVMNELRRQGGELAGLRTEFTGFVIDHVQEHASQSSDWEKRWSGIAVDLAYKRGIISLPRAVLEWLRQYLQTILLVGGLVVAAIGFLTGAVSISVGPAL